MAEKTSSLKDQPLFGPVDQLVNTLEVELSWVKSEIERCEKTIARANVEIKILSERKDMLDQSMKFVRAAEKKRQKENDGPLFEAAGTDGGEKHQDGGPGDQPAALDKPIKKPRKKRGG